MTKNAIGSNIPIEISKGGTNSSSYGTNLGVVKYDGTGLVTSTTVKLSSGDLLTNTSMPAFSAWKSATTANITGDGTYYSFVCDSELFDQTSSYNSATGIFTAPKTGRYYFGASVYCDTTTTATEIRLRLVPTSGYYIIADRNRTASSLPLQVSAQGEVAMTAGDTIYPQFYIAGDAANSDGCVGDATVVWTSFWGHFIA